MKRDRISSENLARQVASIYAFLSSIWIFSSDQILQFLVPNPQSLTLIQSIKGGAFVVITTTILYFFVRLGTRRLEKSEQRYRTLFLPIPNRCGFMT